MKEKDYRPRLIDEQVDFYLSTFGAVSLDGVYVLPLTALGPK